MDNRLARQAQEFARLAGGFRVSRVVLTANNLRVFEHIGKGATASSLANDIGTDPRGTEIVLDAAAALGLLRKSGTTYRLTPTARRFLLPESPWYQGDMLRHLDTLWKNWSGLDDVVRTGVPNRSGSRDHGVFIRAMHNNAVLRTDKVIGSLGLRGVKKALDLGGGPGTYSMALAKKGVAVTLFDLSETIDVARDLIRRSGVKGITFLAGDFHIDDIGSSYDLALLSQVLHSHGQAENMALISKVYDALAAGGQIAIHEFKLNEDHASPVPGALFSVNMLVNTAEGRSYTPREMKGWLKKAGFLKIMLRDLGDTVVVLGKKGR